LNSGLINIVTAGGAVTLPAPITAFTGTAPTSIRWNDDVQNEYYIINTLGSVLPILGGLSYVDLFGVSQTSIPVHTALHIAKAINGSWIQINNLAGSSGSLPPEGGHAGQALFTNGSNSFWGDPGMQIAANDPNWVNGTTWQNGFVSNNPSFSSSHFFLFWNDLSRFLLQNESPPEWQYIPNGFQVLITGWDAQILNVNLFLFFKGVNS
jgi:hypothetical protein